MENLCRLVIRHKINQGVRISNLQNQLNITFLERNNKSAKLRLNTKEQIQEFIMEFGAKEHQIENLRNIYLPELQKQPRSNSHIKVGYSFPKEYSIQVGYYNSNNLFCFKKQNK
jgi:hypothetical protein